MIDSREHILQEALDVVGKRIGDLPLSCLIPAAVHKVGSFRIVYVMDWGGYSFMRALPFLGEKDLLVVSRSSSPLDLKLHEIEAILSNLCVRVGIPRKNIVYACNSPTEVSLFRDVGIQSILAPLNAFINTSLFDIRGEKKLFQCAHVASLLPVKRHELLLTALQKGVSIALVSNKEDSGYTQALPRGVLERYSIISRDTHVDQGIVANVLSRSNVGILLSDLEGGCYASSEYLLCGLPVLSTVPMNALGTSGGRELWYNEYNSRQVLPNEKSVSEGLQELLERDVDRHFIREMALSTNAMYLYGVVNWVMSKIDDEYTPGYLTGGGLYEFVQVGQLIEILESGGELSAPGLEYSYANYNNIPMFSGSGGS